MKTLINIIVSYKEKIRENLFEEILTRFEIVKYHLVYGIPKSEISKKYLVHRNTIHNILKRFKENVEVEYQTIEALSRTYLRKELLEYYSGLKNLSRAPVTHPMMAKFDQEKEILKIHSNKHYGPKRLKTYIDRILYKSDRRNTKVKSMECLKGITNSQIKGVYKRNNLKSKKIRSGRGPRVHLYNYDEIASFEYLHYDTKTITDLGALPIEIYNKFKNNKDLPVIEWNIIDAATRARFLAYSHGRTSDFGFHFLTSVIQFIRGTFPYLNNMKINVGMDNGCEFCMGSDKKLKEWNEMFKPLNTELYAYFPGKDVRKNLIERSHLSDDQEFFIPKGEFIKDEKSFLKEAKKYSIYWNDKRSHSGIGMKGSTPIEKLISKGIYNAKKILYFPTMILENTIKEIKKNSQILQVLHALDKIKINRNKYDYKKITKEIDCYNYFFLNKCAQNVLTQYLLSK